MTTCALFPVLALLAAVFCSYMTFAVGVAAEVIALLLVCSSLDRFGRHTVIAFGQLLGGGACVACALVNDGITQAVTASGLQVSASLAAQVGIAGQGVPSRHLAYMPGCHSFIHCHSHNWLLPRLAFPT